MTAAAESAEGVFASKGGRALAFAAHSRSACWRPARWPSPCWAAPHGPAITLDLPASLLPKATAAAPCRRRRVADGACRWPVTKPVYAGKALLADPALIENTAQGPLPRIADDGRKPMTAYAAPAADRQEFKIAIVVSGLGISRQGHQGGAGRACRPACTLGFAPYAGDVQQWVAQARAAAMKCCWKCRWSRSIFPTAIRARTPCAPARKRKPTSSA